MFLCFHSLTVFFFSVNLIIAVTESIIFITLFNLYVSDQISNILYLFRVFLTMYILRQWIKMYLTQWWRLVLWSVTNLKVTSSRRVTSPCRIRWTSPASSYYWFLNFEQHLISDGMECLKFLYPSFSFFSLKSHRVSEFHQIHSSTPSYRARNLTAEFHDKCLS